MMKQAQQMQERMQKQMNEMRVEATSGGGMVTVVVNGSKQVLSLKIDPEAGSKDDVEMLQDRLLPAMNGAHRKVGAERSKQMSGLMGGRKVPGMSGCRVRTPSVGWSSSSSGCPASARRAPSGWPFTS